MKLVTVGVLSLLLIFLVMQMWYFYERGQTAQIELRGAEANLQRVRSENQSLRADADYYAQTQNLSKELRARFSYKFPDETMIVVVPSSTSSSKK